MSYESWLESPYYEEDVEDTSCDSCKCDPCGCDDLYEAWKEEQR